MPSPAGRVLVVDDDDLFLRVCHSVLRRSGLTVDPVSDPREALERVRQHHYDVIVSDLCMPGVSGISLLEGVRKIDPTVPFVLMTGMPTVETAISAIDLGVHKYLPKPFDVDAFVGAVNEAVRKRVGADDLPALHRRLDRALEKLWMAYQPIVALSKEGTLAYEALLRTTAEEIKGPQEILELAEKTHRIFDVGRAIRRKVAADLPGLSSDIQVFVNLHPADLEDPDLYSADAPLTKFAARVVLEITERASIAHDQSLNEHCRSLRALGFRIAVDDLGAGYSGLTTLARVQPEFVKLDASLVRDLPNSSVNQLIVSAVLDLSGELGSRVVAEAIETPAELEMLKLLGVDLMQGYFFARPGKPFVTVDFSAVHAKKAA
ncbi:MAG: EAL domain-containing protein [Myxococcota bacterium]